MGKATPIDDAEVLNVSDQGSFATVTVSYSLGGEVTTTDLGFSLGGPDGDEWLADISFGVIKSQQMLDSMTEINGLETVKDQEFVLLPGAYELLWDGDYFESIEGLATADFSDTSVERIADEDVVLTKTYTSAAADLLEQKLLYPQGEAWPEGVDAATRAAAKEQGVERKQEFMDMPKLTGEPVVSNGQWVRYPASGGRARSFQHLDTTVDMSTRFDGPLEYIDVYGWNEHTDAGLEGAVIIQVAADGSLSW